MDRPAVISSNTQRFFLSLLLLVLSAHGWANDRLSFNEQLTRDQYLASANGAFRLILQGDGNLVLRDWTSRASLWSTGTHNRGARRVRFQSDGNLVIRDRDGKALWASKTGGQGGQRAVLQNDGNFVIYSGSGRAIWATDTVQEIRDTTPPALSLLGDSNIEIQQNDTYRDAGATAVDDVDGDITAAIRVSGSVDTSRAGTYTLRYDVSDAAGNAADTLARTVVVAALPNDSLYADEQLATDARLVSDNGQYFVAMQGDGNLVLRDAETRASLWSSGTHGTGAIRFRLQGDGNLVIRNASGGAVWSSRTNGQGGIRLTMQNDGNLVLYTASNIAVWATDTAQNPYPLDETAPVIALLGAANMTLNQADSFSDPGATASDDRDGDLTSAISRSGNVDTATAGVYRLFYNVADAAGNEADTAIRTIRVVAAEPAPEPQPRPGKKTAVSTGEFSSPQSALYALNDRQERAFPRIIDTGFGGNGHAETWDGRLFVRKRSQGWFASAFRPERITRNADGSLNFRNGAFGNSVELEASGETPDIHQNWLAIVPDFAVTGENPFPSDSRGQYDVNGTHATYRTLIYQTSTRNGDNDQMGYRRATFIVRDANTRDAQVVRADFTNNFERLRLQNGRDFRCIEPSATMDGRLIICQGHPDNNGRIDNLVYSWNPTPGALRDWRTPKSIANMYWDDRDANVDGMPFYQRFPIAEKPLKDATGSVYNRNALVKGAYPWVSHDGAELFYQASREGVSARRTATTVVGRWTGWIFRHIDGPINPNRHRDTRLFISSPGAFTTMWTPYKNVADLAMPYSVRGPSYPIFGSNNHDYSEVGFDDYLDGNYVLYYGMNEQIDRSGRFITNRTNDTSGHFNNGTLQGARFPLEYNNRDELVGRYGQAVYFRGGDYISVDKNAGWDAFEQGVSVDFWIRKLNGSGTIRLFNLDGGIEVYLSEGNRLNAALRNADGRREQLRSGTIATGEWHHIAATYDAMTEAFVLYLDGESVATRTLTDFGMPRTTGTLRIGPQSSAGLMVLDEVKVSNVAREPYEVQYAAKQVSHRAASDTLLARIPDHLSRLRDRASAVRQFSSAAAELGEELFNDVILSGQRSTSCATCHNQSAAFTDGLPIARGNEPSDAGIRNTPMLLNRLFSSLQGWSGEAETLDLQALVPIAAAHEMNLPIAQALTRLNNDAYYASRFTDVFGGPATANTLARALASFEALQFSPRSRFDDYQAGNVSVLTASERRGKHLFENEARCSGCHAGDNFTDESFRNNGLTQNNDIGRAEMTGRNRDHKLFKVPSLRALTLTAPYMHDGSIPSLREVVEAYNAGAANDPAVDTDIRPLELSDTDITDLVNFLRTL